MMPVIKLAFLDVGQGDTTIISCPETQEAIVVDCVKSVPVIDYLNREGIKYLRGIIVTHLHADHYQQVANLLYNCAELVGIRDCEVLAIAEDIANPEDLRRESVKKKWPPDSDGHSTVYEQPLVAARNSPPSALAKLYQWTEKNEEKCKMLRTEASIPSPLRGTLAQSLEILHPPFVGYHKLRMSGLNNTSIVLRVNGTNSSALLTGDLEPRGWQSLKEKHPSLQSDVLKFPHHGGAWESNDTDDLLSIVKPSIVVMSVGSDNTYDHPNSGAFASLYRQSDIRLLCTEATSKCQMLVQNEQKEVATKFQMHSKANKTFFSPLTGKQCPCAGTVIIELGDQPQIVQPNISFHKSIIKAHYKNHQCYIDIVSSSLDAADKTVSTVADTH